MSLKENLLEKMRLLGIEPKRSLGQNFLIGEHVVAEIINQVEQRSPLLVVEVGPGLGSLTEPLIERNIPRKLIELDRKFAEYWRARGETVIEADALRVDWQSLGLPEGTLLLSNLPYQIGSRLVIEMSIGPRQVDAMILMFQREVAERLVAETSTKDYGFLSVIAQTFWHMGRVVDASSGDFFPAPNVDSRVLSLKRRKLETNFGVEYVEFVKKAFQFRRKFMIKSFSEKKDLVLEALKGCGYTASVRAEEISPADFQKIHWYCQENA